MSKKSIVLKIYEAVPKVIEEFSELGITDNVKDWLEEVKDFSEKEKETKLLSLVYSFNFWQDKDEFKKIITKITEIYLIYQNKEDNENRILIAHNDGEPVAKILLNLLTRKKYDVVLMQDEPCLGGTIFDKFKGIKFDIGIVVLTEDRKLKEETNLSRAKQNVILETGYFYAKLKKIKRVIILYDGKVEIPSNIQGVEYIKIDKNWEYNLLSALMARGLMTNEESV